MKTPQELQSIKAVPIVSYLQSTGHEPVKFSGGEFLYFSPLRTEKSPSFSVNPIKNVFNDFGSGDKGDVIRLVQAVMGCSFREAVATLEKFDPSSVEPRPVAFSFSGQTEPKDPNTQTGQFGIIDVRPLQHGALLQYVMGRGISYQVAQTHLKEVHYKNGGKSGLYAVGFGNDKGGYELRSKYFKASTSPKDITTIDGHNPNTINIFEGFFDFLSACEFFGFVKPRNTTIVLNSLSNLNLALERLKTAKQVNVYFDNDGPGIKGLEKIKATGVTVLDGSKTYEGCKDFNEWLCR